METIYFENTQTGDRCYLTANFPWFVPRQGEKVIVRIARGSEDVGLVGIVNRVEWYYSTGNHAHVATVFIDPLDSGKVPMRHTTDVDLNLRSGDIDRL